MLHHYHKQRPNEQSTSCRHSQTHSRLEDEASSVCLSVQYCTGKSAFKGGNNPSLSVTSDILPPSQLKESVKEAPASNMKIYQFVMWRAVEFKAAAS